MDRPEHHAVFDQRDSKCGACSSEVNKHQPVGIAASIKVIISHVEGMDNWFASEDACHDAPRRRWSGTHSNLGKGGWRSPNGNSPNPLTLCNYKFTERRFAEPHRLFEHCIEYRG